jgi:hypothetical protein
MRYEYAHGSVRECFNLDFGCVLVAGVMSRLLMGFALRRLVPVAVASGARE